MKLFPKQIDFFEIFDRAALTVKKAASLLVTVMDTESFDNIESKVREIYDAEQEGDILTHDIIKKLNKTFVTPIDREDLHALASRLDDVVDMIWGSCERLLLFNLKKPTKEAIAMSKDLLTTTEVLHKAIKRLKEKNYSFVHEYCIEINRLENKIDRHFKVALVELFEDVKDPILIIKWKEVYEHLEEASDRCEDVANILESIILKYA